MPIVSLTKSRHKIVEPLRIEFHSQEDQFKEDPPEVPMADNRTMAQLLQAPTVGALLLDKKNQSLAPATSPTLAPVKAVESNCVTCGDNIHKYVSQAVAANYNQGNTGFRPQMVTNQIRPPGFPPVQNNQNNFNRGNNFT
nr:hypothetical protein [Tanacetum cinerariifolium]